MDLDETECLHCRDPLNSHNPLEIIGCMKFYALDTHTTGLREGLRQAAARLEALIAGATNPTLRDFECLHAELLSDAAPTEVTRG